MRLGAALAKGKVSPGVAAFKLLCLNLEFQLISLSACCHVPISPPLKRRQNFRRCVVQVGILSSRCKSLLCENQQSQSDSHWYGLRRSLVTPVSSVRSGPNGQPPEGSQVEEQPRR